MNETDKRYLKSLLKLRQWKPIIAQMRNMSGHRLFADARARQNAAPVSQEYTDEDGRSQLGVAARIAQLGWTVIV